MFRDEERYTSTIQTSSENALFLKASRKLILTCLNLFLVDVEQNSAGYSQHIDFSREDRSCHFVRLFIKANKFGKVEAKDYDRVDIVAPFVGATVDRW